MGTLGLLEVWIFIVYVSGEYGEFTNFEQVTLGTLMLSELVARVSGALSVCLTCNDGSSLDGSENLKTFSRDQLHNMVYPRSPPRSRKRRDFAALAWHSLLVTALPVVLLLSFYPAWGTVFDEAIWIRVVPSVLAVLAVFEAAAGFAYMECNQSSYVLTGTSSGGRFRFGRTHPTCGGITLRGAHESHPHLPYLNQRGAREEMPSGGSIDLHLETSKLHLELSAALKEDVSRKKTDEMKKRAVHTAASYDEFRHMVSCAQLTPVTRKEMEMLSYQKRGWHGRSGGVVPATKKPGSTGRRKAAKSTRKPVGTEIGGGAKAGSPVRAPRDYSQFQRDWRRLCRTDDERRKYLRMISPDKLPILFRVEMEPDILGQVLSLICGDFMGQPAGHELDNAKAPTHGPGGGNAGSTTGSSRARTGSGVSPLGEAEARLCVEWLSALSRTGRFAVNILFLEEKEKLTLGCLFDMIMAGCRENSDKDTGQIHSLRKAYAV
eukprot:g11447.t2